MKTAVVFDSLDCTTSADTKTLRLDLTVAK